MRVNFYAREAYDDAFDFLFPQNYIGVPKVRDGCPSEWLTSSLRSNARYRSQYVTEDGLEEVPISSKPDEVDVILSFMEKAGNHEDNVPFPLILEDTRKKIEEAEAECLRRCPFDGEELL